MRMRSIISLLLAALLALGAFGCAAAEEAHIEIWLSAFVSTEEKKLSQDQWTITKVLNQFMADNPGVTIDVVYPDEQRTAHQMFKAAAVSGSAPDVVNLWGGSQLLALSDLLLPLDSYIPAADLEHIIGWEVDRAGMSEDGTTYAYPALQIDASTLFYNRQVIKAAGLDFDQNPPATVEAFLEACEKIKEAGFTPIECNDISICGDIVASTFGLWWAQASGLDRVYSNSLGESSFAQDEGFLGIYTLVNEMYDKGYLNQDYLTSVDGQGNFLTGKSAMLADGNWSVATVAEALGEENLGILALPPYCENPKTDALCLGGPGQSLAINKDTPHPELCVKLISYLCSKDVVLLFKDICSLPARNDITLEELGMTSDLNRKVYQLGQNYAFWIDNAMWAPLLDDYTRLQREMIVGTIQPEEAGAELDRKVQELILLG